MDKHNPACYECTKGKDGLHTWQKYGEGAKCVKCGLKINKYYANEVFTDVRK